MRTARTSTPWASGPRRAIGYLSTWSESKYPIVNLSVYSVDTGTEIIAAYRTETGAMAGYMLVAVWDADQKRFTFHS